MTWPHTSYFFQFGFSHSAGGQWKEPNTSQHFIHNFGHFLGWLMDCLPKSLLTFYRFRFLLKLSKLHSFSLLLQSTYFASYPAPVDPTPFLTLDAQCSTQFKHLSMSVGVETLLHIVLSATLLFMLPSMASFFTIVRQCWFTLAYEPQWLPDSFLKKFCLVILQLWFW